MGDEKLNIDSLLLVIRAKLIGVANLRKETVGAAGRLDKLSFNRKVS